MWYIHTIEFQISEPSPRWFPLEVLEITPYWYPGSLSSPSSAAAEDAVKIRPGWRCCLLDDLIRRVYLESWSLMAMMRVRRPTSKPAPNCLFGVASFNPFVSNLISLHTESVSNDARLFYTFCAVAFAIAAFSPFASPYLWGPWRATEQDTSS